MGDLGVPLFQETTIWLYIYIYGYIYICMVTYIWLYIWLYIYNHIYNHIYMKHHPYHSRNLSISATDRHVSDRQGLVGISAEGLGVDAKPGHDRHGRDRDHGRRSVHTGVGPTKSPRFKASMVWFSHMFDFFEI